MPLRGIRTSCRYYKSVASTAAAVEWTRIVELITAPGAEAELGSSLVTISGQTKELFMDWHALTWLRRKRGVTMRALVAFRGAATDAARQELVRTHRWSEREAASLAVDSPSLLVCMGGPGQPPHVDIKWRRAQFFLPVTPDCRPTRVFNPTGYDAEPAAGAEPAVWDSWALRPLRHARHALEARMMDLEEEGRPGRWRVGVVGGLSGRGLHAGPAVPVGTLRVVFFFTVRLPEAKKYLYFKQLLPFVYHQVHGTKESFKASLRDWTSHEPWKHYYKNPEFALAIQNFCNGLRGWEAKLDAMLASSDDDSDT